LTQDQLSPQSALEWLEQLPAAVDTVMHTTDQNALARLIKDTEDALDVLRRYHAFLKHTHTADNPN
jgi:DNA-binding transcriptional MocR family regulator